MIKYSEAVNSQTCFSRISAKSLVVTTYTQKVIYYSIKTKMLHEIHLLGNDAQVMTNHNFRKLDSSEMPWVKSADDKLMTIDFIKL